MIREERNALLLLLGFTVAAAILYVLVLRPALHDAIGPRRAAARSAAAPAAEPEVIDARPREARRMVSLRATLRDAATGAVVESATAEVLHVEDIAEPAVRVEPGGLLAVDYLPPDVSFALRVRAEGYLPLELERLRGAARDTLAPGALALEPRRTLQGRVVAADGAPLAGARIAVLSAPAAPRDDDDLLARAAALADVLLAEPLGTATSAGDGGFVVAGLPAVPAAAYVIAPGHAGCLVPALDLTHGDGRVDLRLHVARAASGRLVLAAGGAAVPDTRVVVIAPPGPPGARVEAAVLRTGDDGGFTVPLGAPGVRFVCNSGDRGAAAGAGPFPFPAAPAADVAVPAAATLCGVVRGPDRRPVAGASVAGWSDAPGAVRRHAVTDGSGRFSLTGVAPGLVELEVRAPGFAVDRRHVPLGASAGMAAVRLTAGGAVSGTVRARGVPLAGAVVEVPAADRRVLTDDEGCYRLSGLPPGPVRVVARAARHAPVEQGVEVRLDVPATCDADLVPGGDLRLLVKEDGGTPCSGVRVVACEVDGALRPRAPAREATTDATGTVRFAALAGGREHALLATGRAVAPVRSTPFLVLPEHGATGVALTVRRGGALEGTVLAVEGVPIAGAAVELVLEADPLDAALLALGLEPAVTDAAGRFRLTDLPPGRYRAVAWAPGRTTATSDPQVVQGGAAAVGVRVTLAPAPLLRGRVLDRRGRGVAGAVVLVRADTGSAADAVPAGNPMCPAVRTDHAGRFACVAPAAAGLVLVVEARGRRVERRVDGAGEPLDVTLEVP